MPPPTKARMILALYDAFKAGVEQGEDAATSYEWGCAPRRSQEDAFADLLEKWETGWGAKSHIRKALVRCK